MKGYMAAHSQEASRMPVSADPTLVTGSDRKEL